MDSTDRLEGKHSVRCVVQQGLLGKVVGFGCPYLYFCHFRGEGIRRAGWVGEA